MSLLVISIALVFLILGFGLGTWFGMSHYRRAFRDHLEANQRQDASGEG